MSKFSSTIHCKATKSKEKSKALGGLVFISKNNPEYTYNLIEISSFFNMVEI